MRLWCQTAYYLEILDCGEDKRFRLAPHMGALLTDSANPFYFGCRARFMAAHWTELLKSHPAYYRTGAAHSWEAMGPRFSRDAKALTSSLVPMAYAYMIIPAVPGLKERLEAGARVLDLGCGAGHLIMQMAGEYPRCTFVGVEIDGTAVEDARSNLEAAGLKDPGGITLRGATTGRTPQTLGWLSYSSKALRASRQSTHWQFLCFRYMARASSCAVVISYHRYPRRRLPWPRDMRELLGRINSLRRAPSPPISGLDYLKLNHASFYCDPHQYAELLRSVYEDSRRKAGVGTDGTPRIAVFGCPVAVGDYQLHELVEDAGAVIVAEEIPGSTRDHGSRTAMDGNLMENLAQRYYAKKHRDVYRYPGESSSCLHTAAWLKISE